MRSLGKRLTATAPPDSDDLALLNSLLLEYDDALQVAVERLENALGIRTTTRLKTVGTILEKPRRSGGGSLPNVYDLAGIRIVEDFGWIEQDEIVRNIESLFPDGLKEPKVLDRRLESNHGYRAVHVIVYVGTLPVEIQVRTELQHEWANTFEKLADFVGRDIRYGGSPDELGGTLGDAVLAVLRRVQREDNAEDSQRQIDTAVNLLERFPKVVKQAVDNAVNDVSDAILLYEGAVFLGHHSDEIERDFPDLLSRLPSGDAVMQTRASLMDTLHQHREIAQALEESRQQVELIYEAGSVAFVNTVAKYLVQPGPGETQSGSRTVEP